MNLSLRIPTQNEWRICRMLLPETFSDLFGRTYLLCITDAGLVVGAASFRRSAEALTHLRVHVIPPFRRRGAASWMIGQLAGSIPRMHGSAELTREPYAHAFCEHNGFREVDALTTVEADIEPMRGYLSRMRQRFATGVDAYVIRLGQAPVEQVARLHAQHVAQEGDFEYWRALMAQTAEIQISPVVMIDGHVAGVLLGKVVGNTAVVSSRVVAPGYHRTWVNALLIGEALDIAWSAGANRARFSYTNSNRDTQKLASRFQAVVVETTTVFERRGPKVWPSSDQQARSPTLK